MSETAVINLAHFGRTKTEIESFVQSVINELDTGEHNIIDVAVRLKAMEDAIKQIRKQTKEMLEDELCKYGQKSFQVNGVTFQSAMRGVKYDYSNDAEWVRLNKLLKDREALLKGLKTPMADPETGEMLHPPIKTGTESYSITLAK